MVNSRGDATREEEAESVLPPPSLLLVDRFDWHSEDTATNESKQTGASAPSSGIVKRYVKFTSEMLYRLKDVDVVNAKI